MPGAEARLRQRIRSAMLRAHPRIIVWGMPASAFTGPGRADLFGAAYARPFNFEVKTATGKPTKIQEIVLRECRRAGSYAWIVRTPLAAVAALDWIQRGGRSPMPDDILDIEDWFKDITDTTVAEAPEPDHTALVEELGDTEAVVDLLPLEIEPDEPETNGQVEPEAMTTLEDGVLTVLKQMTEVIQALHKDVRAVGDRVTITWQSANRLENNLLFTNQRLDKLIAMILEEEAPDVTTSFQLPGEAETEMEQAEPAPKTRRRRAART